MRSLSLTLIFTALVLLLASRSHAQSVLAASGQIAEVLGQARGASGSLPYGSVQLQLMKTAIFETPADANIVSIIDSAEIPAAQALVDKTALRIFTSSAAREAFCPFIRSEETASHNFGVSRATAAQLLAECTRANVRGFGDINERLITMKASRRIVFVETTTPAPVESWTSQLGDVHIFYSGILSEFEFTRILTHEYYVAFDRLYNFGYENSSHFLAGEHIMARGSALQVKTYYDSFFVPLIRGTFLMTRAFNFEAWVLGDLYGAPRVNRSRASCWDQARVLGEQLLARQDLFVGAAYFFLSPADRLAQSRLGVTIRMFDLIQEHERNARMNRSLCEFMSEPQVGYESSFFTAGPRPRLQQSAPGLAPERERPRIGGGTERRGPETVRSTAPNASPERTIRGAATLTPSQSSPDLLQNRWPLSFGREGAAAPSPVINLRTLQQPQSGAPRESHQ